MTEPRSEKAHRRNGRPLENTKQHRQFSAKSTAREAQYQRIIALTRTGDRSTIELRKAGVMMPAARVKELREQRGYDIQRVALRDLYDEEGFLHPRVAIYSLLSEPAGVES